jgi:imidazolonepropionase-like amidohydrolase
MAHPCRRLAGASPLVCLLLAACVNRPAGHVDEADVIIRHINVVDVVSGTLLPDQLVAIKSDTFMYVGPDPGGLDTVAGARYIDGGGRYAIPGLWDMHVHVCWSDTNAQLLLPVLLAHGITGVRDMGGDLRLVNDFKQRVLADPTAGPEIWGCGPIIDGDPPVFLDFTLPVDSATDITHVLDSLAANGADFFKVYSLLRPSELERIATYSEAHQRVFAGHLSEYIEPEEAVALGQHSVEHLNRLDDLWNADPARLDSIASLMVEHDAWSCPTLIIYHRKSHMYDPSIRDTMMDKLLLSLQAEWDQAVRTRQGRYGTPHQRDSLDQRYRHQLELVKRLHDRGVRLMAGSDLGGMPLVYPGTGLLEELEHLSDAGLSNAEALRSATSSPAEYLHVLETRGTIASGKQANLVILAQDPLVAISAVRSIKAVFHRGTLVIQRP